MIIFCNIFHVNAFIYCLFTSLRSYQTTYRIIFFPVHPSSFRVTGRSISSRSLREQIRGQSVWHGRADEAAAFNRMVTGSNPAAAGGFDFEETKSPPPPLPIHNLLIQKHGLDSQKYPHGHTVQPRP